MSRPLPWTDIVAAIGEEHFDQIRASLDFSHTKDLERDAFLLNGSAAAVLRELMPEEAPAEMVSAYGELLHMLYVMWARGWPIDSVQADELRALLASPVPLIARPTPRAPFYLQLPERLVWAEPAEGETHEPLDGVFVIEAADRIHALAVLGFREGREGFTTMEGAIRLPAPAPDKRLDGSAPFASTLPGGESAKLISVVDEHELAALALACRER